LSKNIFTFDLRVSAESCRERLLSTNIGGKKRKNRKSKKAKKSKKRKTNKRK
jgi:hypothetical protein